MANTESNQDVDDTRSQRDVDSTTSSMDVLALNNLVVSMRSLARQVRLQTINQLTRKSKNLKSKKGSETQLAANQKKAAGFLEEVAILKTLDLDHASKFALANTKDISALATETSKEERAKIRFATHKLMTPRVQKWRDGHSDWKELAAFMLSKNTGRRFKKKKQQEVTYGKGMPSMEDFQQKIQARGTGLPGSIQDRLQTIADKEAGEDDNEGDEEEPLLSRLSESEEDRPLENNPSPNKKKTKKKPNQSNPEVDTDVILDKLKSPAVKLKSRKTEVPEKSAGLESEKGDVDSLDSDTGSEGCSDDETSVSGDDELFVRAATDESSSDIEESSEHEVAENLEDDTGTDEMFSRTGQNSLSCKDGDNPDIAIDPSTNHVENIKTQSKIEGSSEKVPLKKLFQPEPKPLKPKVPRNKEMVVKKINLDNIDEELNSKSEDVTFLMKPMDSNVPRNDSKKDAFFLGDGEDEEDEEAEGDEEVEDSYHNYEEEAEMESKEQALGMLESTFIGHLSDKRPQKRKLTQDNASYAKKRWEEKHTRRPFPTAVRGHGGYSRGQGRGASFQDQGRRGAFRGQGRGRFGAPRGFREQEQTSRDHGHGGESFRGGRGSFRGHSQRGFEGRGRGSYHQDPAPEPSKSETSGSLHPSWEASRKRKEQQQALQNFQGKKTTFDD